MALIHTDADLHPGKLDLLAAWLPQQTWAADGAVVREATFRFDDPGGQVGLETFLLRVGNELLHVPLTYRGEPLDDGALVGEMEHSVLGRRWVYDAATDPVYVETVIRVIVEGGQQAALVAADGTELAPPPTAASVRGSGVAPGSTAGPIEVVRRPGEPVDETAVAGILSATWSGQVDPVALVLLLP